MTIRTIIGALLLAITFAVAEVVVRWQLSPEEIQAPQLALAVFANVSVLGLAAILFTTVGCIAGRAVFRAPATANDTRDSALASVFLGAATAALIVLTEGLGLGPRLESTTPVVAAGLLIGLAVGGGTLAAYRKNLRFVKSSLGAGGFAAWLLCVVLTGFSVARTNRAVTRMTSAGTSAEFVGEGSTANASSHRLQTAGRAVGRPTNPGKSGNGSAAAPNVVVIVLDTLRADCVGRQPDRPKSLTPHLDHLAESSVVYTNAISTAPWTLPTHASLFTGLYPQNHGVSWGNYVLDDRYPVLAELLKAQGYNTFAVSNNWLLSGLNGFARGFDTYIETANDPTFTTWRLALQTSAWRWMAGAAGLAPEVGEDAGSAWTNWLVRRHLNARNMSENPLFLFINYFEPHDPYRPPAKFSRLGLTAEQRRAARQLDHRELFLAAHACGQHGHFSPEEVDLMRRLYEVEVAYQDHAVGELLGALKARQLFDNSWIVVTSDHGELFGEWDMVYHTASSHYKLLHIPLIVRPPGGAEGRRVDALVQPVDIFATLLEAADVLRPTHVRRAHRLPMDNDDPVERVVAVAQSHGASIPGMSMTQRLSLQTNLTSWLTWVDTVVADGYLLEISSNGRQALFHVAQDPNLEHDQLPTKEGAAQALAAALAAWSNEGKTEGMTNVQNAQTHTLRGGPDRRVVDAGPGR